MTTNPFTQNNFTLRSRELTSLSRPLSVLLVLLFSLTIHINTALAVGGNNPICTATRIMSSADDSVPAHQIQLEHCGICIVSIQYKSFGLQDHSELVDGSTGSIFSVVEAEVIQSPKIIEYFQIRAPPHS